MTPEPAADRPLSRRRFTAEDLRPPAADSAASRALFAWYAPGFSDRLGDRLNLFDNTDGPPLELLRLRAEFSRVPDFEFSLRARASELRDFNHPRFARVCRVDRLPEPGGGLALVSVRSDGVRLSDVLRLARERGARMTADLLLPLVTDAADALAILHAQGPHVAHGAIGADRLVIAPGGHLLIAEYVLGSALRGLSYSRADAWRHLRLALPADPATPAFTQSTDVFQLGLVSLALASSRPIDADEDLGRLSELLGESARAVPGAGWDGRWPAFEAWLRRSLRLGGAPFPSACEAAAALAQVVPPGIRHARAPRGEWDQFVAGCEAPPILPGHAEAARPALAAPADPLDERDRSPAASDGTAPPAAPREGPAPRAAARGGWRPATLLLVAALVLATLGGGVVIGARLFPTSGRGAENGSIQVDSSPPGVVVSVDGAPAGRTPVTMALAPGAHLIELTAGTSRRTFPVTLAAGARLSHFVEMPTSEAGDAGTLRVTTEPGGLRVLVDGTLRGTSPLEIARLAAGAHVVTIEGRGRRTRQAVEVSAGATAALFVPMQNLAAAPGWLNVASEIEMQVLERGELLGTSRARIMLPAGRHELDLLNEELGVRVSEDVQVLSGGTAVLEVTLPQGRVDVNALPWAEVWLDGRRIGDTPLGAVPARVGRHLLRFRHPQLGERTVECVVAAGRATRIGVDLRK